MKIHFVILFAAFSLLFSQKTFAAGGPDAYGYTWKTSFDVGGPTYNWIDITSKAGVQTVSGLADDNSAASMINIGFNFHYYWNDYTQLKVGSNGWLSFNNISNIASCFPTIPTSGGAGDNLLAMLMGDLNFTGAGNPGQVQYWSNNVDTCVVSFINVPFWTSSAPGWTGSNSFQAILCAADSSITFQYGSLSSINNNGGCVDLTVGIENSTGAIGLEVHSDVNLPSNYAIKFEYPDVVLLSIQDPLPNWNDNSGSKALFIPNNYSKSLSTNIGNAGNTAVTTTITLQGSILNSASTTIHSSMNSLPSLAAGDDTTLLYPNNWTPAATGQYSYRTVVSNSQDINSANNTEVQELEVVDICAPSMLLSYNTSGVSDGSLNWNGGANDDGAAVYFEPPVYPYTIANLEFYIASNVGNGYIAQILDDDGPNGTAGTILFNQTVGSGSVVTGTWNSVNVSTPVTLNDGGYYVVWYQGGTNIFLGTETAGPRSHRNYEILDGGWGAFRFDETQDLMIRSTITGYSTAVTADFTETTNLLNVGFTNNSTGVYTTYAWDFGDGGTSAQQNPSHTYSLAGTYTVCLITTTLCSADTTCHTVTVCDDVAAAYSFNNTGSNVTFTDVSTGAITNWYWDFGDANTSTAQNPSHTYANAGTYNVCLITQNTCGDADTICQLVTVCDMVVAQFSESPVGLDVFFTDESSAAVLWSWDFGDGGTSALQNPSHTFAAPGTYNVCLTAVNACGETDNTCVAYTVCEAMDAEFNQTHNGLEIDCVDATTGSGTSWFWDFGDGGTSTLQNPSHTYANAGTYNICLIVNNACTADTDCYDFTFCELPFASFTHSENGLTVDFSDASSSANSWSWDFGDGNVALGQNPSHVFAVDGTYNVCLTVTNACGETNTSCEQITVSSDAGISENTVLSLNAYPNPTDRVFFIDFGKELNNAQLDVIDLTGKVVFHSENVSGMNAQLDAAKWATGLYNIRVIHESGIGNVNFVKD